MQKILADNWQNLAGKFIKKFEIVRKISIKKAPTKFVRA
jgi:hypothetical protein